jgi:hypothetical protein
MCAQMKRMMRHASGGQQRRVEAANTGKLVFQLDKICKDLHIDTQNMTSAAHPESHNSMTVDSSEDQSPNEISIIDAVIHALRQRVADSNAAVSSARTAMHTRIPNILQGMDKSTLTPAQVQMLGRINEAVRAVSPCASLSRLLSQCTMSASRISDCDERC